MPYMVIRLFRFCISTRLDFGIRGISRHWFISFKLQNISVDLAISSSFYPFKCRICGDIPYFIPDNDDVFLLFGCLSVLLEVYQFIDFLKK